ncbi:hypothetical protein BE73_16635 [Xanthomonas oryzae pv. oryzicola]|nr:hypothetical protein BE73_16635 [Xanthomonas oryzae pv. oryzicola]
MTDSSMPHDELAIGIELEDALVALAQPAHAFFMMRQSFQDAHVMRLADPAFIQPPLRIGFPHAPLGDIRPRLIQLKHPVPRGERGFLLQLVEHLPTFEFVGEFQAFRKITVHGDTTT